MVLGMDVFPCNVLGTLHVLWSSRAPGAGDDGSDRGHQRTPGLLCAQTIQGPGLLQQKQAKGVANSHIVLFS